MIEKSHKLLIVASLFYPQKKSGGPPVSILNLVKSLSDSFQIRVVSNNYELNEKAPLPDILPGWNRFEFGEAYYYNHGVKNISGLCRLIKEINPDVIYQNSFFSYDDLIPVLLFKRFYKRDVKVIIAPRGELYPKRMIKGWVKKVIYIKAIKCLGLIKDVYFHSTSDEETKHICLKLKIPRTFVFQINNLSQLEVIRRDIVKYQGEIRLLYLSRIHPMKNLKYLIESLMHCHGHIIFDFYGPIEDKDYWHECQRLILKLPANVEARYRGIARNEDVSIIYSNYHVTVLPSNGENYGHSIVDSLINYRPVIISDQTPWTDIDGKAGFVCKLSKLDTLHELLDAFIEMDNENYQEYSTNAGEYIRKKLPQDESIKQYKSIFNQSFQ